MIQGFYAASVAAQQQMNRLTIHGNNIANINTYGFKAESPAFGQLMYGMMTGVDENDVPRGTGAYVASTATDYSTGGLSNTGRSLDYAIFGQEGYFCLRDLESGEISYTRDGSFTMSSYQTGNGETFYLSDGMGRQVLDANRQPIEVTDDSEKLPVGVFNIPIKDGMLHVDNGRFLVDPVKNGAVTVMEDVQVEQGFLEDSNADLANEMARVIETQRAYGYALTMVKTADEIETTINSLRG